MIHIGIYLSKRVRTNSGVLTDQIEGHITS